MELSVIIPAFNEEKRVVSTLDAIKSFLDVKGIEYETIVVDDGSSDATSEVVSSSDLGRSGRLTLYRNEKNMGKGYSVKKGVSIARGEYMLFSNADLSAPVSEYDKLKRAIDEGADVAVGSRSVPASDIIQRQSFCRIVMGKVFNLIVRMVLGEKIRDTQCGFKLFRSDPAKMIFNDLLVTGFAFDVEALFLARRYGCRIEEVGVRWENSPGSTVHLFRSSFEMLIDVLRIKLIHK